MLVAYLLWHNGGEDYNLLDCIFYETIDDSTGEQNETRYRMGFHERMDWNDKYLDYIGTLDGYCRKGMDGDCIQYKVQTLYID